MFRVRCPDCHGEPCWQDPILWRGIGGGPEEWCQTCEDGYIWLWAWLFFHIDNITSRLTGGRVVIGWWLQKLAKLLAGLLSTRDRLTMDKEVQDDRQI